MGGLILLFILGVWFFIAKRLTSFLTTKMQVGLLKKSIQVLLFVLILMAPVGDEIIGGFQFRALCEAETQIKYDKDKLANKEVYWDMGAEVEVHGLLIPVVSHVSSYKSVKTGEQVLYFKAFSADGGWLSHAIDFNSVHHPYTFNGYCGPDVSELFGSLYVKITEKPLGN